VGGGDVATAIARAFAAWAAAGEGSGGGRCTDMQFVFGGVTQSPSTGLDGRNRVVVRRGPCEGEHAVVPHDHPCIRAGTCAEEFDCWEHDHLVAVTTTTYRISTGEILDSDIELNGSASRVEHEEGEAGFRFTCVDPPARTCGPSELHGCIATDLENAMTHEIGHFLGFDHSTERDSTMYARTRYGETAKRTLSADAVTAMCGAYPAGEAVVACGTAASGCSTSGGATGIALLGLAPFLRRRTRQRTTTPA
jgi:hypothetical protein